MTYKVISVSQTSHVGVEDKLNEAERDGWTVAGVIPYFETGYTNKAGFGPMVILHRQSNYEQSWAAEVARDKAARATETGT